MKPAYIKIEDWMKINPEAFSDFLRKIVSDKIKVDVARINNRLFLPEGEGYSFLWFWKRESNGLWEVTVADNAGFPECHGPKLNSFKEFVDHINKQAKIEVINIDGVDYDKREVMAKLAELKPINA